MSSGNIMSLADTTADHRERIRLELIQAGISKLSLKRMECRHLPGVIKDDEHIKAAIYGLSDNFSALIAATNQRIIYSERKPFYKMLDEVAYDMISGVRYNLRGGRANVILHTRVKDYSLRFVAKNTSEKFVNYIESVRLK
jgi:hypothetical protein